MSKLTNWQDWAGSAVAESNANANAKNPPHYIPILPRHKVRLFCVHGDGRRFARLFRQAWSELPLSVRRKLVKHWRESRPRIVGAPEALFPWPGVELINDKSDFYRGNSSDALAQYKHQMCSFSFHSAWMDALPDHAVECVVAHELAHAVCFLEAPDRHAAGAAFNKRGFSRSEHEADALAKFWGFDVAAQKRACRRVARKVDALSPPWWAGNEKEVW
ncbi:MAG: hypothetical protein H8E35_13635 [Ardenticatenia bacterium]|nr:hypothetical protein [Ardenticatenia bacterium]